MRWEVTRDQWQTVSQLVKCVYMRSAYVGERETGEIEGDTYRSG